MSIEIRAFHAGDGDCLLITGRNGTAKPTHILVDGGRSGAFRRHAAPYLYNTDNVEQLDLVIVSHVDNDHISGVLRMVRDHVAYRVWQIKHARNDKAGTPKRKPKAPPPVKALWHNSVQDHFGGEDNSVKINHSLAASASILGGSLMASTGARRLADDAAASLENLATGHRSAIELEGRLQGAFGIEPVPQLLANDGGRETMEAIGSFMVSILGPTTERMESLRKEWEKWIAKNEAARTKLVEKMRRDEERMGQVAASTVTPESIALSSDGTVTVPNLASLMMIVQQDGRRILLTGDGSSEDIMEGLEGLKVDNLHFDVLKVQHHGATANVSEEFCKTVSADHYIFCGDGRHSNPELEVVRRIAKGRLVPEPDSWIPDTPFKFWFTSSSATPRLSASKRSHMEALEAEMEVLEENTLAEVDGATVEGRLQYEFLDATGGDDDSYLLLELGDEPETAA